MLTAVGICPDLAPPASPPFAPPSLFFPYRVPCPPTSCPFSDFICLFGPQGPQEARRALSFPLRPAHALPTAPTEAAASPATATPADHHRIPFALSKLDYLISTSAAGKALYNPHCLWPVPPTRALALPFCHRTHPHTGVLGNKRICTTTLHS
jgi:hypothetical protein